MKRASPKSPSQTSPTTNMVRRLPLVAGLLVGIALFGGCGHPPPMKAYNAAPSPPVPQGDTLRLSPELVRRNGIATLIVSAKSARQAIDTTGVIRADDNRLYRISSLVGGRISRDHALLGESVRQGQTLAVVDNLDVIHIQADYLHQLHQNELEVRQARTRLALANRTYEREKRLLAEGISPRKDYYQAQNDAELAKTNLEGSQEHGLHIQAEGRALLGVYGMSPGRSHSERIRTGVAIRAPRAGVIIAKHVTLGDVVDPQTPLYEVADLSRVWLDITVYPGDLSSLRQGQQLTFVADALPGKTFAGEIDYLPAAAGAQTQSFLVRAFLPNPAGALRPGLIGRVRIQQPQGPSQPWLPDEALQHYGRETFVLIEKAPGQYRKRPVVTGARVEAGHLVTQGIATGERVVGQGAYLLKSELLKGQLAQDEDD